MLVKDQLKRIILSMKGEGDPELQTVGKPETSVGMRVKKGEVKLMVKGWVEGRWKSRRRA